MKDMKEEEKKKLNALIEILEIDDKVEKGKEEK